MSYQLFFLKENNRYIDIEELFRFFSYSPYITNQIKEEAVTFIYNNENIGLKASFILSKKSAIPDVYRLDPKYLDLDFRMEIDPLYPNFKVGIILDIVNELCVRFNIAIYNPLFENVSPYQKELVLSSYELYRDKYREKHASLIDDMHFLSRDRLTDIFKYLYERNDLIKYYQEEKLYFPDVTFLKSRTDGRILICAKFLFDEIYVFPPKIDLILLEEANGYQKYYYADELLSTIDKLSYELPGFGHNTLVLQQKAVKKMKKILNRYNFSEVCDTYEEVSRDSLIDFK